MVNYLSKVALRGAGIAASVHKTPIKYDSMSFSQDTEGSHVTSKGVLPGEHITTKHDVPMNISTATSGVHSQETSDNDGQLKSYDTSSFNEKSESDKIRALEKESSEVKYQDHIEDGADQLPHLQGESVIVSIERGAEVYKIPKHDDNVKQEAYKKAFQKLTNKTEQAMEYTIPPVPEDRSADAKTDFVTIEDSMPTHIEPRGKVPLSSGGKTENEDAIEKEQKTTYTAAKEYLSNQIHGTKGIIEYHIPPLSEKKSQQEKVSRDETESNINKTDIEPDSKHLIDINSKSIPDIDKVSKSRFSKKTKERINRELAVIESEITDRGSTERNRETKEVTPEGRTEPKGVKYAQDFPLSGNFKSKSSQSSKYEIDTLKSKGISPSEEANVPPHPGPVIAKNVQLEDAPVIPEIVSSRKIIEPSSSENQTLRAQKKIRYYSKLDHREQRPTVDKTESTYQGTDFPGSRITQEPRNSLPRSRAEPKTNIRSRSTEVKISVGRLEVRVEGPQKIIKSTPKVADGFERYWLQRNYHRLV